MFPLVHIYTATQVSGKKSPQLVVGSILPDLVWVDREKFPVKTLHDDLTDFRSFIASKHLDYADLATGMMLHSNKIGADKYAHVFNGGFAIVKGKEVVPDLSKILNLDEGILLNIAHHYIEASLDLLLVDRDELIKLYRNSLQDVELLEISKIIGEYSNLDEKYVDGKIIKMFELLDPENLKLEDSIANILSIYFRSYYNQKLDHKEVLKLIQKSIEVISEDSDELYRIMISGMKKDFLGTK